MRDKSIKKYKEKWYLIIWVFMNLPIDILKNRIKISKKDFSCLRVSKDFNGVLDRQKNIFEEPKNKEFDYFFEIKSENDLKNIKNNIIDIVRK